MSPPLRVLVADDNEVDRLLLTAIVRREGHEVVPAVDGFDALEKFNAHQPQLVLLDVLMPGMDGLEVAREVKRRAGDAFVPVIFLTSLTEAGELAQCLEAGGDDFLSKPYNKIILRAKLTAFQRMWQMHATAQDQRDELRQHHARLLREQDAAKRIFDSIAHPGCLSANNIQHWISPLAVFNGDVLLAARTPGGNMYVLLGDFTGHGLPASIGAMPLAEIFYGMTQKGFDMVEVLREANRKLKEVLPIGYFCCAAMADFNFQKRTVEIWNGGLPDAYIWRPGHGAAKAIVEAVPSCHLPLGVLEPARFALHAKEVRLEPGDRLLMCTDGIVDAHDRAGEPFGAARLETLLRRVDDPAQNIAQIRTALAAHVGVQVREDDYAIVQIEMMDGVDVTAPLPTYEGNGTGGPKDWRMTFELGPESLARFNPLPLLQHMLMEMPSLRARGGEIFTVLSELYTNALDHGVLELRSVEKQSRTGFVQYYQRRADALERLGAGSVRFEFISRASSRGGELNIRVIDSGAGFDYSVYDDALEVTAAHDLHEVLHGRGLPLVRQLCDGLSFHDGGNAVEAVFRWGAHDGKQGGKHGGEHGGERDG